MLSSVEAQVCGVCCTEEDRFSASTDYMEWLQCGIPMCNLDTHIPDVRLVGNSQRANYDAVPTVYGNIRRANVLWLMACVEKKEGVL